MSIGISRFARAVASVWAAAFLLGSGVASAQPVVYVANSGSNNVSAINTATNVAVATIPVGRNPFFLAATPDGSHVYVSNVSDNTVSVISTATNAVVATIPGGVGPNGVAVTPNGALVYVANGGDNTVSVISSASYTVIATVSLASAGDSGPNAVTVSPDGHFVYVVSAHSLEVLSTATNTITATISVPGLGSCCTDGNAVAISPDGANVYVGLGYGFMAIVNTATNQQVGTISASGVPNGVRYSGPNGIAISPDGTTGYATLNGFPQLSVFSTATGQVATTIPVGSVPYGVALSGSYAYVANYNDGTVSVVDTDTDAVVATIPVGASPAFLVATQPPTEPPSTCTVTDTADDPNDAGSLRYCIASPIAAVGFASNLNGQTITLNPANGPLTITANKTIQGPGPNLLTISGGNAVQVFAIVSGTVNMSGFTIANGNASGAPGIGIGNGNSGGGINNYGALTLVNMFITNNTAPSGGGGIFNNYPYGTLTVINSTVSGNSTLNLGGGIDDYGSLTVSGSTFIGNIAGEGGGIQVENAATVINSTFSGNIARNGGGAIYVAPLFYGGGTLTAVNITVSGNTVQNTGGGGIVFGGQGTLSLLNDIVAGNASATPGDDCDGCGTPNSSNLISTPSEELTPELAPIGWYGGSTQTMLPLPGSPAICAGSASLLPAGLITDQRGFPRLNTSYPGYGGSAPCLDVGAVQTNYESIQFDSAGYNGKIGQVLSPAPVVSVTENGQNIAGIPVTLLFNGAGMANGLGPITTVAGTGATFSGLSVDAAGADTLSTSLQIVGSFTLSANAALTITPVQTTPTISWPSPAAITYGTALGEGQLDATASVPGTFVYSPAAGTVLQPGTHTLSVTFTPSDLSDYTMATASVTITVEYGVCALYDQTRSVHSGAAYPIKLYLCSANGADVSSAAVVLHATNISGVSSSSGEVEDTGNANPDNDFRFDSTLGPSGGYIFNLSTTGLSTGTYSLLFTVGNDTVVHSAIFGVK